MFRRDVWRCVDEPDWGEARPVPRSPNCCLTPLPKIAVHLRCHTNTRNRLNHLILAASYHNSRYSAISSATRRPEIIWRNPTSSYDVQKD